MLIRLSFKGFSAPLELQRVNECTSPQNTPEREGDGAPVFAEREGNGIQEEGDRSDNFDDYDTPPDIEYI
ncbi:hypothetical protein F2P81_003745 [Scophthalmus maximus]|uniref:Uncharacterized protein n=1 Tax=Scophthalmus maximus TaxID=52904 RepID=A0A6A4TDF5_SCOMX|nr:hypothetical protein F2P81_003745 [Scophthalmus maximus]